MGVGSRAGSGHLRECSGSFLKPAILQIWFPDWFPINLITNQFPNWFPIPRLTLHSSNDVCRAQWKIMLGVGHFFRTCHYCHRDTPFHPDNKEWHLPKCHRWCWHCQNGYTHHRDHRDLSMHLSAFQQRHHQPSRKNPRLSFVCLFFNGSRALPVLGPQHPKPLPQVWTHEWVTDK